MVTLTTFIAGQRMRHTPTILAERNFGWIVVFAFGKVVIEILINIVVVFVMLLKDYFSAYYVYSAIFCAMNFKVANFTIFLT